MGLISRVSSRTYRLKDVEKRKIHLRIHSKNLIPPSKRHHLIRIQRKSHPDHKRRLKMRQNKRQLRATKHSSRQIPRKRSSHSRNSNKHIRLARTSSRRNTLLQHFTKVQAKFSNF